MLTLPPFMGILVVIGVNMYIEYRCPNVTTKDGVSRECRAIMGGPSKGSLSSYDFSKRPFKDVRFCPKCKVFYEVVLNDINMFPIYRVIEKGHHIEFQKPFIDNMVKTS